MITEQKWLANLAFVEDLKLAVLIWNQHAIIYNKWKNEKCHVPGILKWMKSSAGLFQIAQTAVSFVHNESCTTDFPFMQKRRVY